MLDRVTKRRVWPRYPMSTGTVRACSIEIEFTLKPGKRREFSRSFEDLHGHEGEGHIRTTVYEDREEPGHMIWIADWVDRLALERYMRGDKFGVLIGGLRVLGTLTSCRLVDETRAPNSSGAFPTERLPRESRWVQIDLDPV